MLCSLVVCVICYGGLFSHHASPLEGYVFVVVDDRGEDVLPDEICHRCNGKQQRKRRGVRSVQPPDWVMILTFVHVCIRTYYVHDQITRRKTKKKQPPEVRSWDGHVEHVCKSSGPILLKTAWTCGLSCGKHVTLLYCCSRGSL